MCCRMQSGRSLAAVFAPERATRGAPGVVPGWCLVHVTCCLWLGVAAARVALCDPTAQACGLRFGADLFGYG